MPASASALSSVALESPRAPGTKADEAKSAGDPLAQMGRGGAVLMVCRTCGKKGDHWTSRCPYKDLAQPSETFVDKPPTETNTAAGGTKGAYVPPSMRGVVLTCGAGTRRTQSGLPTFLKTQESPTWLSFSGHLV